MGEGRRQKRIVEIRGGQCGTGIAWNGQKNVSRELRFDRNGEIFKPGTGEEQVRSGAGSRRGNGRENGYVTCGHARRGLMT